MVFIHPYFHQKNGEKVAVKVFNVSSYQRPDAVQDREFEVLHRLQHENIVRLLAIEDDVSLTIIYNSR